MPKQDRNTQQEEAAASGIYALFPKAHEKSGQGKHGKERRTMRVIEGGKGE